MRDLQPGRAEWSYYREIQESQMGVWWGDWGGTKKETRLSQGPRIVMVDKKSKGPPKRCPLLVSFLHGGERVPSF